MYTLNDKQIDFILDDIRARGIETEDLQYNLLDHICCIVEHELEENEDFGQFYQKIITRFFKNELSELEVETQLLLTFKHYYTMKKIMLVSGFTSALMMLSGAFFKFMHWPGANFLLLLGIVFFSLLFLPLMFTLRLKEKKDSRNKVMIVFGLIVSMGLLAGALFKLFHWPGATAIGFGSLLVLILLYVPFYLFTGLRNPETKVNTAITSILMIAGCAFLLILPGKPKSKKLSDRDIVFIRNEEKAFTELRSVLPIDSALHVEQNSLIENAERLKEEIAQKIGSVSLAEYLNDSEKIVPEYLTETEFNELPARRDFLKSVNEFEKKSGIELFEVPETGAEPLTFETAFSQHKSITELISFITLLETKACIASAKKVQVAGLK